MLDGKQAGWVGHPVKRRDDADGHGYYLAFPKKSGAKFLETGYPPPAELLQKSAF